MSKIIFLMNLPRRFINYLVNYMTLKRQKVTFKTFPLIYGTIILKNNGYCKIGDHIIIRNSIRSNYVGLTKKCSLFIEPGAQLEIGDYTGLSGTTIYCSSKIIIGSHVNLGGNVFIWDTDFHPLNYLDRRIHKENQINSKPIIIGNDVFVGANSMILKGVNIGDRSIIGAGSVLTKSVPDDEIWGGNPARFLKKLSAPSKLITV